MATLVNSGSLLLRGNVTVRTGTNRNLVQEEEQATGPLSEDQLKAADHEIRDNLGAGN